MCRTVLFVFFNFLIATLLLSNCEDQSTNESSDAASTQGTSGSRDSSPVIITGSLALDPDADEALLENRKVNLEDAFGNVIASGFANEAGEYEIQAGSLSIDSATQLLGSTYLISSLIEDDGLGRTLGIKQELSIDSSNLADGIIDAGTSSFLEIAAIKGIVKFVNADGTENIDLSKLGTDVFLPGFSFFAKTDQKGSFLLLYIPAASYTLRVEKGNFSYQDSIDVEEGKTLNLGTISIQTDTLPPITSSSKESTDFRNEFCVSLTSSESSKTYFSTDGSNPTASNIFSYSEAQESSCGNEANCKICIQEKSTNLKYFSVDLAGNTEGLNSKFFYFNESWADPEDKTAPTTAAKIDGQTAASTTVYLSKSVTVRLDRSEGGKTYYTTDGSTPSKESTVYNGELTISLTTTLRYYSVDYAANAESIQTLQLNIYRWQKKSPSTTPEVKSDSNFEGPVALTYDSARGVVVLVSHTSTSVVKTYEWTANNWLLTDTLTLANTPNGGQVRLGVQYIDKHEKLVMIYGYCNSPPPSLVAYYYSADSNNASTNNWASLAIANSAPSFSDCTADGDTSITYIDSSDQMLVIPDDNSSNKYQFTIDFSGGAITDAAWNKSNATSNRLLDLADPSSGAAVAYGLSLNKILYYGGAAAGLGITYTLPTTNLTAADPVWTEIRTDDTPPTIGMAMGYNPNTDEVIMFGGTKESGANSGTNEFWSYTDSDGWKSVAQETKPTPRQYAAMVYIPDTKKFLLFGGKSEFGEMLVDTWEYSY